MTEAVIIALITSVIPLIGVVVTSSRNAANMDSKLDKHQAVMDTKIDELTREVREHNNFARRMPVVEEQIRGFDRRLRDLEEDKK